MIRKIRLTRAEKSGPAEEQKPQNTISFTLVCRAGMAAPGGMADMGAAEGKAGMDAAEGMGAVADTEGTAGSACAEATKSVGILA